MKFAQVAGLVVTAMLLASCGTARLTEADIAGTYSTTVLGEPSIVELHADGTAVWTSIHHSTDVVEMDDLDDPQAFDLISGEGTWVTGSDPTTSLASRRGVALQVDGDTVARFSVAPTWFGLATLNRTLCDPDQTACTIVYVR